ncbi:MAG: hypothetical protein HY699_18185 [Deltaproteobacteria bacterium]|nr:hypothetical protein [Deltaproteobacteria bacterium]
MLLLALVLVAGAFALYTLVPALLLYWIYPWPVYVLLAAAVGAAVMSRRRGWLRPAAIATTALLAGLFVVYSLLQSQLHPAPLAVRAGDVFPEFTLKTSTQESFSPAQLKDRQAALYIFYRGDW